MKQYNILKSAVSIAILLTFFANTMQAQTIRYVKPNGIGDGSSWANAAGNIQSMIDASTTGHQVWISGGTYLLPSTLEMKEGVNIYGGFFGNETSINARPKSDLDENGIIEAWEFTNATVLDGQGTFQVLRQNTDFTVETIFDGVTITKGNHQEGNGAYIKVNGKLINSIVRHNTGNAVQGGGIYNFGGTVTHCLVSENSGGDNAPRGGGIFNRYTGTVEGIVSDSRVENNLAGTAGTTHSGGIHGGIVIRCIIKGNHAIHGGGLHASTAYNCLIINNTAGAGNAGSGGGSEGGKYYNCTFVNNSAVFTGGGIANAVATNCIFWQNNAQHGTQIGTSGSATYSAIQGGFTGTGNITLEADNENGGPMFIDPTAGNYQLQATSPCIDKGDNTAVQNPETATDLAGNPRIYGGTVDMGCYEWGSGVGIKEPVQSLSDLIIFPNPTNGMVYITANEAIPEITLYSTDGRMLKQVHSTEIDMSQYAVGIYFLRVSGKTVKVVKQ